MYNHNISSKFEYFVKLFNKIFHRRKLVIFIGKNGTKLVAIKWQRVQDSLFVEHKDNNRSKKYHNFLKKHKNCYIILLLDNKECTIKNETIPFLSSLLKNNPVNQFIAENHQSSDIVAYDLNETTNQHNSETWNCFIASSPFVAEIRDILKYVINNSFKYSGAYFLSLESQNIINEILHKTQNTECSDHLIIFVTITQSSDVLIITKYKHEIIDEQTIDYPKNKSDMYIIGTIEQAVSDKLIFYKDYIKQRKLKTCIILLLNETLNDLTTNLKFDKNKIISISAKDISSSENYKNEKFQDNILMEKFINSNTYLALNQPLKLITKLSLFNSIIFKPLFLMAMGALIYLAILKYQAIIVNYKTDEINQKYYSLSQEYREAQKQNPNLTNIGDLIDLYNLEKTINNSSITQFQHLKYILSSSHPNLYIKNIKWNIDNSQNIGLRRNGFNININLVYKSSNSSTVDAIETINQYVDHLRSVFPESNITYTNNTENITQITKRIFIPVNIIIKGSIESGGNNNVR